MSALVTALLVLGIGITVENPASKQLENQNHEMIEGFSTLVENRDDSTGGHIKRTRQYVELIINEMRNERIYTNMLTKDYIHYICDAAPMHDIGKVSTPDSILQKPGKLTADEFEVMKKHAAQGGEIIKDTFVSVHDKEFLDIAYLVARHHHEKWNGKGYPDGLAGTDIPLCARIVAIADVFDAVSAKRCYRDALPIDECFEIIEKGSGTDFDPELVKVFLNSREGVERIMGCPTE